MSLLNYFFISNLMLLIFYIVFYVTVRKETHFKLNRAYLLFALLFSAIFPLVEVPDISKFEQVGIPSIHLETVLVQSNNLNQTFNWLEVIGYIYIIIAVALFIRLVISVLSIIFIIIHSKQKEDKGSYVLIKTNESGIFSFFYFLFWNDSLTDENSTQKIIEHELTHIRQRHSLDIILVELFKIFFWFNPIVWFIQKDIRINHEYLADAAVHKNEKNSSSEYAKILLANVFNISPNSLENNFFNHSLTKKRIAMLTQKKSLEITKWKYLLTIPAIFMGLYFASCSQETEEIKKEIRVEKKLDEVMESNEIEEPPTFPGGTKAMIQYITENLEYPSSAKNAGIEGTTFVKFTIDETGAVSSAEIEKGFDEMCDAAALEVVKSMPNWEMPDLDEGEEIKIELVLPVKFVLAD